MKSNRSSFMQQLILLIFVIILQLGSIYLSFIITGRFENSVYGLSTFGSMLLVVLFDMLSGFIIMKQVADFLLNKATFKASISTSRQKFIFWGVIPLVFVIIQCSLALFGLPVIHLIFTLGRPIRFPLFEWISHSHIPAFWLGAIINLLYQPRKSSHQLT